MMKEPPMSQSSKTHLQQVVVRDGSSRCHYCNCLTNQIERHPQRRTKDHIVPRCFGGANTVDNYVLACHKCNNKRGNSLVWCWCAFCKERTDRALNDPHTLNAYFESIMRFNKPKIKRVKRNRKMKWGIIHSDRLVSTFKTWDEAMSAVQAMERV